MAKEFYITAVEKNAEGIEIESVKMRLVDFLTKVHAVSFNEPIEIYHDFNAKFGQKIKAKADREPFTIILPSYKKGDTIKDIEIKVNALKNNVTLKGFDGVKVNGLDELVFSKVREKASFEYDIDSNSWNLW